MNSVSKRIHNGANFRPNRFCIYYKKISGGNFYILSKNSISRNTQNYFISTHIILPNLALVAFATSYMRITRNQTANLNVPTSHCINSASYLYNFPQKFMP